MRVTISASTDGMAEKRSEIGRRGQHCRFRVAWTEFYILDACAVGYRNRGNDLAAREFAEPQRFGFPDAVDARGFQDGEWDDGVGCQEHVCVHVDGEM